jgi:hypothetical protein
MIAVDADQLICARPARDEPFMIMALLLDLANIVGGLLLAVALLRGLPRVGDDIGSFAARIAPFGWLVGLVALVTGGYYLIVHLVSGPHLVHYEVVGIGVGLALLWKRLTGQQASRDHGPAAAAGPGLLLAAYGIIAIVVGIQGLFTPDA